MNQPQSTNNPKPAAEPEELTQAELSQLSDKDKQEEFRKAYLAQLRQQQCPGCGETDLF